MIHEHGMFFHLLYVSSSITFITILNVYYTGFDFLVLKIFMSMFWNIDLEVSIFVLSFSVFSIRAILALLNEFGTIPSL